MIRLAKIKQLKGVKLQKPTLRGELFIERCNKLYENASCDWVVIYGDREHFSNLVYLCGFDPRFEEAILVLGKNKKSFLIIGHEGLGHLPYVLKTDSIPIVCKTMSLQGQPRNENRNILQCFQDIGIKAGDMVGVIGWKYAEDADKFDDDETYFFPEIYIKALKKAVGTKHYLKDKTSLLMDSTIGMKSTNELEQLLFFEWAAVQASEGVNNMIINLKDGITEFEAATNMGFFGEPFSMHSILTTGKIVDGLTSPRNKIINKGDAGIACIGYWGGTTARSGVISLEDDLFIEKIAKPYFNVIIYFYENMKIGMSCGEFFDGIEDAFGNSGLHSSLNPGHLGSYDEWVNSPVCKGSTEKFHSGSVFQVDVIPTPLPEGYCANCEDTIALIDNNMRAEIKEIYPDFYTRISTRRDYIQNKLGINISEDIVPLNDYCAYFQPLWLKNGYVLIKES